METKLQKEIQTFIHDNPVAMFCTQEGQKIKSRPMLTLEGERSTLFFISNDPSLKTEELKSNPHVNLCYMDDTEKCYVCVHGDAQITHDQAAIQKMWRAELSEWFKEGPADPKLALIKVSPTEVELWDDYHYEKHSVQDFDFENMPRRFPQEAVPQPFAAPESNDRPEDDNDDFPMTSMQAQRTMSKPANNLGAPHSKAAEKTAADKPWREDQLKWQQ
jgi:general stress protein 26